MLDTSLEKLPLKEEYAFHPEKRAQIVQTLHKGTPEYYIYHLQWLSQQFQQKHAEGQALTAKEIDDASNLLHEAGLHVYDQSILDRFRSQLAVLAYDTKPEILLKELAIDDNLLKEASAAAPQESSSSTETQELGILKDLPSALDQDVVKSSTVIKEILDQFQTTNFDWSFPEQIKQTWAQLLSHPDIESILLDQFPIESLETLVFSYMDFILSPVSLEVIGMADASQADVLIVKILLRLYKANRCDFGSRMYALTNLTNAQLKLMRELEPSLMDNEGYVAMLEQRIVPCLDGESLAPVGSSKIQQQEAVHQEWIMRMCNFVMTLSPKFNCQRHAVYYLDVQSDLRRGVYSKEKFLRFISVPQRLPNANSDFLKFVKHDEIVNLGYRSNSMALWSNRVSPPSYSDVNDLIEEYLHHLLLADRSTKDYEAYFDKAYLDRFLARVMLLNGDKDTSKWSPLLGPYKTLDQLAAETFVKFSSNNPTRFLPSDPVSFKLRAKNAGRILVRVFEIKTFEYLQHFEGVVGKTLDLDGLSPNWEISLTSERPPIEEYELTVDLPQLANKRGAFIMDVISNGTNSCIFFTKGCLDYVERYSAAGHVLTILDENNQAIRENCSVWLNGHTYKPNSDGDIIIPYAKAASQSQSSSIKLIHDGFTTEKEFNHHLEQYELRLACHLDREAVISGHAAKVLIKPTLMLSGSKVTCPISLLEQVVLNIESTDMEGTSSTTTVNDFKFHDVNWASYTLQIPENMMNVLFTLSGKVKVITTGEYQDLSVSYDLDFENPLTDMDVDINFKGRSQKVQVQGEIYTLLRKSKAGYHVIVLGKNGEKRSDVPLRLEFYHYLREKSIVQYLRSNENGLIDLGPLQDIQRVACPTTGSVWKLSEMHHDHYSYPSKIHAVAGETIHVPCLRDDLPFIRKLSLFSYTGPHNSNQWALDDYTRHVKKQGDFFVISGLDVGFYTLHLGGDLKIDILMAKSKNILSAGSAEGQAQRQQHTLLEIGGYKVEPSVVNTLSNNAPIPQLFFMSQPTVNEAEQTVDVQLHQWSPYTRVCVVAGKFAPSDICYHDLAVVSPEDPSMSPRTELTPTVIRSGRILSEEYQYILNRKAQSSHWVGNLLTKPSTLLTPWSVADTKMDTETMKEVDDRLMRSQQARNFVDQTVVCEAMPRLRSLRKVGMAGGESRTPPLMSFLAQPSVTLLNLVPESTTGIVRIPLSSLKDRQFVQVFAVDGLQTVQRTLELTSSAPLDFMTRDLRFKSILDYQKHYMVERSGTNLIPPPASANSQEAPVASVTLASTGSSSDIRVIQSVRQIYNLLLTLVSSETHREPLRSFGFVVDWARMSNTAKNEKFSKFCSHELNLFLYEKDRAYFDAVVAPFLKNKLVKSFVDEYLLELPLDRYCALNEFHKLTALEKVLLARRVPAMRPIVKRWMQDRVPRLSTTNNIKLFQTIMKSGSLDEAPDGPAFAGFENESAVVKEAELNVEYDELEESDEDMGFGFDFVEGSQKQSASNMPPPTALFGAAPSQPAGQPSSSRFMKMAAKSGPPGGGLFGSSGGAFGFGGAARAMAPMSAAPAPVSYAFMQNVEESREKVEEEVAQQFKQVDLTKVQAETYYYQRQDHEDINNSDANAFWLDYVQWQGDYSVFLSQNFVVNTHSFTDAMATLALMGVSFDAAEVSVTRSETRQLVVSAKNPAIVFHASTKEVASESLAGTILLTQKYYAQDEKYVYDERLRCEVRRYLSPDSKMRPLKSYGAHVILMNATSNPARVFLDLQLPQGAMSIHGVLKAGHDVYLEPHETFQYEYGFYFPEEGDFSHYPAHVSDYENIVAYADPVLMQVRAPEPDRAGEGEDKNSWPYLLQWGTKDEILAKLESSTLTGVPMDDLIRHMVKDPAFYKRVVTLLRTRREYHDRVWSLAVVHRERETLQEYLARQPIADQVGYHFESQLLTIRPTAKARGINRETSFEVLEFFPLINARAHRTKKDAKILNDKFREQYDKFMTLLSQKAVLDREDLMLLVVYLVAQEQIVEAKEKFARLANLLQAQQATGVKEDAWFKLQYDYLWIYLQLCVETPAHGSTMSQQEASASVNVQEIQKVLSQYRNYPVKRWCTMFEDMQKYVDEIVASEAHVLPPLTTCEGETATSTEGQEGAEDQDDTIEMVSRPGSSEPMEIDETAVAADGTQTEGKATSGSKKKKRQEDVTPMADFKIGSDNVLTIRHRNVHEITVEYYAIDAEAMFSASPLTFVEQSSKKGGDGSGDDEDTTYSTDTTKEHVSWRDRQGESATATNSYRYVKPNAVDVQVVQQRTSSSDGVLKVPILPQYVNKNCMISVTTTPAAATKQWRAYYSQTIAVDINEKLGLFRVVSKKDNRPIRGGYVKVYAQLKNSSGDRKKDTVFWKDGYTDLVGRFNYAQVSSRATNDEHNAGGGLSDLRRFVVYVDGGPDGCVIKTAPVPPV
ncbi:hypothetical protein BGW42_003642 [Actinomortierella wolfii]|nr:hypothetical protein BGW42_003642 [Actinomortierella wolfii]